MAYPRVYFLSGHPKFNSYATKTNEERGSFRLVRMVYRSSR